MCDVLFVWTAAYQTCLMRACVPRLLSGLYQLFHLCLIKHVLIVWPLTSTLACLVTKQCLVFGRQTFIVCPGPNTCVNIFGRLLCCSKWQRQILSSPSLPLEVTNAILRYAFNSLRGKNYENYKRKDKETLWCTVCVLNKVRALLSRLYWPNKYFNLKLKNHSRNEANQWAFKPNL